MICPNCKKTIPENADFCKFCGSPAPFSSGVDYHPETLFPAGAEDTSKAAAKPSGKELADMEARLNEKLYVLAEKCGKRRYLLPTIAALLLVAGLAVGSALLVKRFETVSARLDGMDAKMESLQTSAEGLTAAERALDQTASDFSDLLNAEKENDEAAKAQTRTQEFKVTFYANLGDAAALDAVTMKPGDVLSLTNREAPTREGFVFTGWNTSSDGKGTPYASDASVGYFGYDVELYAQWEEDGSDVAPTTGATS